MKYSCNLCGYLGDHGPQHNVPGLPLTCSQSADPIEDVPVEVKPTHPASHQDGDARDEAAEDEAMLRNMLAKAAVDHEASLARLEQQPEEHREFQRLYLEALYGVRCSLIVFQFEALIMFPRDSGVYSAIMLELANEFTLSGLELAPVRTLEERKAMMFRQQERMMLTGIKRKLLPPGNQPSQILNARGQPVHRKPRSN